MESEDLEPRDSTEAEDQEISNQAEVKDRLPSGSVSENEDDLDLNRGQADDFDNLGDDPLSPGPETPPVTSPGNPGPASPEEPPPQDQDELHGEDISQPQQHDLDLSPRETAMSEGSSPESKMHVDDLDIQSETQKSLNNDGSGKEYPDSNFEGEYDGDEANTSNDYSRTEKQTESKHSDDGSGSESINSSLVSQRTLETTSENMDVAPTTGSHDDHYLEKDQESVGGSSKAEDDGHVVVGLEALDSLATENGRCGSPSIVSEATDTVAGSLVVETGSLGGESGTVRSMPQSETSDVDYQDVENGEEMTYSNYPSEAKEMNDTGETGEKSADESEEDMEVTQETVELGPKSPQDPETEENNENSELTSRNVDQSLVSSSTLDHTAAGNDKKHITTEDRGENEEKDTASYSRQDSLDSGEVSEAEDFKSQEPPPDDDFDYDDLDLEPVSENEASKPVEKERAGSVSEVADSSEVTEHDTSQESRVRHSSSKSDRDSHKRNRNRDAFHGIDSRQSKPRRSPKGSLSDDDVELDYDEEGIAEEKTRHVEIVDDDLENGELPDDDDEGEIEEKSDDGELEDDDDCEEGEIREPGSRKPFVKPICRFYLNSKCTWGNNCRFLHPGVNDKGNYRLIDRHDYNNKGRRGHFGGPGPGPWSQAERVPEPELPPPVPEPQPSESAWERGLRHAKELMKKASHRKETDPGFEEKRLNLSLEEEREFNKENDQRRLGGKDAFVEPSFEEELYEKPIGAWQPGQYENFEVRWQREPDFSPYRMQDKDRGFRDRRLSPPSPRMGHPAYMGNQPHAHPMQHDNRYNKRRLDDRRDKWREPAEEFNSGGPRVRADVWHDPWRRSKSPKRKPRDSPSRSRSRGRRRYRRSYSYSSSYSSRSRSRSSYSSLSSRSSLSRTSSFSSRSRSRSLDIERRRPPGDPLTSSGPTLGGRGGGPVGGAKGGVYMAGAGPQGDRKIPPNNKPGEPRSAVSIKQRHQRPGPDQRRPVIGPMPRPSVRDKPLPFSSEGRGRGMIDRLRDDRGRGRGRGGPKEEAGPGRPGRPPGKKRGASISSSGSSQSRSRSRSSSSTSRSQSVSSVSSVTSSSSSSSSGSADSEHLYRDIAEPEPGALDKDRAQGPAGRGRRKEGAEAGPGGQRPGPRADRDRGHRGSKDRPPREKRPRRSPPPGMPPGGRGMRLDGRPDARPDMRRGPMIGSGKPQVSSTTTAKSKDPMKSVGQKSNIKLTLISKPSDKNGVAGKKRPADGAAGAAPAAKRPPISPTKQPQDKAKQRVPAGDKPGSPKMRPPQAPLPAARPVVAAQGGRLPVSPIKPGAKPATPAAPTPASVTAAAAAAAKAAKKSTSSRREELLKQLKAVEDAIARKRSKLP